MPVAQRLYLTEVDQDFDADAFFPDVPPHDWEERSRETQVSAFSKPLLACSTALGWKTPA